MFKPTVVSTDVDSDSASITIKDTTGTYPATTDGYGAPPDAPANYAAITKFFLRHTYTGEDPVVAESSDLSGTPDTGITAKYAVTDGVHLIELFYGVELAVDYDVEDDEIVRLSGSDDWTQVFQSAWGVAQDSATFPTEITAKATDRLTLKTAFDPDVIPSASSLWVYYRASVYVLVTNTGATVLVTDICNLSIAHDPCDFNMTMRALQDILLKQAAETAFANEDYTRAHEAAVTLASTTYCNRQCNCA